MIEKLIKPYVTPVIKKFLMPLKRLKNWPKLLAKFLKRFIKSILGQKEITKDSYWRFGDTYVSKKLIVIVVLIILILYFFLFIRPPKFINKMFHRTPSFTVAADGQAGTYTGDAKVKDASGNLLFKGKLADGQYDGEGKLYWENGVLKEQGTFAGGMITDGSRYDEDGRLIYSGLFADNVYQGQGRLYYPNGNVSYQGEFMSGSPNGAGSSYSESGKLLYEGGYANGGFNGDGTAYDATGAMIYQGGFLAGKYDGTGKKLFADGVVQYSGAFVNGKPSGAGSEFFESGNVKYEGDFLAGLFSGNGTLYSSTGTMIYTGGFLNGNYQGEGELYGDAGLLVYKGAFAGGKYHGQGQQYNAEGALEYQGSFANGKLDGLGTWYKDDGSVTYKGYFAKGELNPSAFLGLSAVRLEELLGKSTSVEVLHAPVSDAADVASLAVTTSADAGLADDPNAVDGADASGALPGEADASPEESPSLLVKYPEMKLSFVVEMDPSGSGDAAVQEVQIGNGPVLERLYQDLSAQAKAEQSTTVLVELTASSTFVQDKLIYRFDTNSTGTTAKKPISATIVSE
ncbi:MORN repeat-containing protein [Paenibacillus sacheonensis]|uniref:Antitoxin component YwqK of the YwqJK toxin-antitoxin module n=1 Tax=Paenibacillus sacheonensis TaxID=742054 RepID=A0A7X5BZU0_9BACL|nr:hypothetical protein [Paenibacillus sacheonensis]MBM7568278.1 antitoxin component YwqK of YwqJK toxin-antitoxin module [Paenibacillus sacheonensis]NBC68535.1 hypothetical protein [Paenibacillus sacheonensis]